MLEKLKAYIDSFNEITILTEKDMELEGIEFYLVQNQKRIKLEIISIHEEYQHYKFVAKYSNRIELHKEYYIVDNNDNYTTLRSGSIIRCPEFDELYKYDGPLGAEYSKNKTIFRVWTPVAKEIVLELINKNKKYKYSFNYVDRGLWECEVKGDLEGYGYLLNVRVFDEFKCIPDPYATASSANGKYNYIIDPDKLYKMKYTKPHFSGSYTDAIIYEASIRDFTYYLDNENKGNFLGLVEDHKTECGESTGLNYIASLGVTHLQLLPIFDFGGVDDINKNEQYNWGYNPEQYFVPSGWYSKNPDDPYSRINELLELVDECHKRGLRVIMDVVFNHVYKHEEFPFDYLVPGYYYRVGSDGFMSNASFCGNDFASERYMASRFIIDCLKYYTKVFNMSGFRFDLMGLLDIETLNKAHEVLKAIDNNIMLYGEGWNMNNPLPNELRPHMYNHAKVPGYAFFNDRFRDFIRGSQFDNFAGFAFESGKSLFDLYNIVLGSCLDYYKFKDPSQSVNYVECHDNYTFYDYGKTYLRLDESYVLDAARLAIEIVLISEGIPFIHGGEEFYRTKQGVENSYNTKDEINRIDYDRRDKYLDMVNTLRDIILIRKEYECLRSKDADEIKAFVRPLEALIDNNTFSYVLSCQKYNIFVIIKNDYEEKLIKLDNVCMIFDGYHKCDKPINQITLNAPGVYLFKGEKSKWS
ncbi:MAG: type I pullulanase [Erysipelotrichaceae bacterium]|nr:type I pullulanase [Erysipelotrichaceae bacterium]